MVVNHILLVILWKTNANSVQNTITSLTTVRLWRCLRNVNLIVNVRPNPVRHCTVIRV